MKKLENDGQFSTLGFFFYDVIHIITAIIILIALFVSDAKAIATDPVLKGEFAIVCINEFAEIILGVLLIFFTIFIYKNVDVKIERFAYTYAYVIASIAILLPSISNIVDVIINSGREAVLPSIQILFPLAAMVLFGFALFQMKNDLRVWSKLLIAGMICMLLSSVADLVKIIIDLSSGEEFEWLIIVEFTALLAPILPIAFGLKDLKKMGLIFNNGVFNKGDND